MQSAINARSNIGAVYICEFLAAGCAGGRSMFHVNSAPLATDRSPLSHPQDRRVTRQKRLALRQQGRKETVGLNTILFIQHNHKLNK